jgi:hypothetical protein
MLDLALFYVKEPNLLIHMKKIHKKVIGCFEVFLSYKISNKKYFCFELPLRIN